MRFDGSDGTALLAITLSAAFAVVATGSMTLEGAANHDHVHVRTHVAVDQQVAVNREVRQELRSVVVRGGTAAAAASARPVIYVDGVRIDDVDGGGIPEDLDSDDIESIEVVNGGEDGRSVRISLKRER